MSPEAKRGLIVIAVVCGLAAFIGFASYSFALPFIPAAALASNTFLTWLGFSATLAAMFVFLGIKNRSYIRRPIAEQVFVVTAFSCLVGWGLLRATIGAGAVAALLVEGQANQECFRVIGKSGPAPRRGRHWLELEAIPPTFSYRLTISKLASPTFEVGDFALVIGARSIFGLTVKDIRRGNQLCTTALPN